MLISVFLQCADCCQQFLRRPRLVNQISTVWPLPRQSLRGQSVRSNWFADRLGCEG